MSPHPHTHHVTTIDDWHARLHAALNTQHQLTAQVEAQRRETVRLRVFRDAATRHEAETQEGAVQRARLEAECVRLSTQAHEVGVGGRWRVEVGDEG